MLWQIDMFFFVHYKQNTSRTKNRMLRDPQKRRNVKKLAAPAIYANVQSADAKQVDQRELLFVSTRQVVKNRDQTPTVMSGTQFAKEESGRGTFYGIAYTDYDKYTRRGMNTEGADSGFVACVAGMTTIINKHADSITAGTLLRVGVSDGKAYMRPLKDNEWYADAKAVTTARKEMQMDIILRPAFAYPGSNSMLT